MDSCSFRKKCDSNSHNNHLLNGKEKVDIKKRVLSTETKNKISNSLLIRSKECKIIYKKCPECENTFIKKDIKKNRKIKFCSKLCVLSYNRRKNKNNRIFKKKKPINKNMKTIIYRLEYPKGVVRYIGKSNNPTQRLRKQIREAKIRNKNRRDKWINNIINNKKEPILIVIEEIDYTQWQEREIYWINFYKNNGCDLVNGTIGGEGSNGFEGRKHTQETKNKLRKIREYNISIGNIKILKEEEIKSAKLTENQVLDIRKKYKQSNISYGELSLYYNVTKPTIYKIVKRRTWKHI